jgi:hypothetical protein
LIPLLLLGKHYVILVDVADIPHRFPADVFADDPFDISEPQIRVVALFFSFRSQLFESARSGIISCKRKKGLIGRIIFQIRKILIRQIPKVFHAGMHIRIGILLNSFDIDRIPSCSRRLDLHDTDSAGVASRGLFELAFLIGLCSNQQPINVKLLTIFFKDFGQFVELFPAFLIIEIFEIFCLLEVTFEDYVAK